MASLEGEDNDRTSNTPKTISDDNQADTPSNSKKPRESFNGLCAESEAVKCAVIALSNWNWKVRRLYRGPEYELVEALGCRRMVAPTLYHCNFIARPENGSQDDNQLFFAELDYSKLYANDGDDVALGCYECYRLGPSGTETGLLGCLICESHPNLIHHPIIQGAFTKGREDARTKFRPKEMRRRLAKKAPRFQLCYNSTGLGGKKSSLECAQIALSSWNKISLAEQGPEYELVDALKCYRKRCASVYHSNFIARPKNGNEEAEIKLFFAEVMYKRDLDSSVCKICCILGPNGAETGLFSCGFCKYYPGYIQHPHNKKFKGG